MGWKTHLFPYMSWAVYFEPCHYRHPIACLVCGTRFVWLSEPISATVIYWGYNHTHWTCGTFAMAKHMVTVVFLPFTSLYTSIHNQLECCIVPWNRFARFIHMFLSGYWTNLYGVFFVLLLTMPIVILPGMYETLSVTCHTGRWINSKADSRLAPSQWEMSLQSNAISHWLGKNLESALNSQGGMALIWN